MKTSNLVYFSFLILISLGKADVYVGTLGEELRLFPLCAQNCMTSALSMGICSLDGGQCVCTDSTFRANFSVCMIKTCSSDDIVFTQKMSIEICGAPIRDQSSQVIIVTIVMSSLAAIFMVLRFVYKLIVAKLALEQDDWFAMACLLGAIPNCVITVHGSMANGLGKDAFHLTSEEIVRFARYLYIMIILYYAEAFLIKLTFICFYKRAFPSPGVQRLLLVTFIVTSLLGSFFVIIGAFQCQPAEYFWTRWGGEENGKCLNPHIISYCNAAIGIILDLWIMAVPLAQLPQLQLHWKKKIGVAFMFCVGIFDTIISMVRLKSLVDFSKTSNSTWAFTTVNVWSTVEICVGIMCACLPTLRLFLVRLFPVLSSTTHRINRSSGVYSRRPTITPSAVSRGGSVPLALASSRKEVPFRTLSDYHDDETSILTHKGSRIMISEDTEADPFSLITVETAESGTSAENERKI